MGREWYRTIRRTSTQRGHRDGSGGGDVDSPSGCMTSALQLLDFHPFHFCLQPRHRSVNTNSLLPREPPKAAGKSIQTILEIEAASLSPILEKDLQQGLQTNPMRIQTKTRRDTALKVVTSSRAAVTRTRDADLSSESGSSPGPKTPNLVARLMGLDLIPESPSPSIRSGVVSTPQRKSILLQQTRKGRVSNCGGTRSLPESPRTSAGRRSDVHPRLSLQINRENNNSFSYELGGRGCVIKPTGDETRSPVGHTRQIVRQVKESVVSRRRFGADITNTVREKNRGDELVAIRVPIKSKKSDKATSTKCVVEDRSPRPSMPAPATVLPAKYRTPHVSHVRLAASGENQSHSAIKCLSKPPRSQPQQRALQKQRRKSAGKKWEKSAGKRFGSVRLKRTPEEPSVREPASPSEAAPICNELISKKSSTPPHRLQWPARYPSQPADDQSKPAGAEFEYIATVLRHSGIRTETRVSISSTLSPTRSLDTSIFELLEASSYIIAAAGDGARQQSCRRGNQRLLFSRVEELLKPVNSNVAVRRRCLAFVGGGFCGHTVLNALCREIRSFPSADCKALEDIDTLVEGDLSRWSKAAPQSGEGCEVEEIVAEVQRQIMDALVRETVVVFGGLFPVRRQPPRRPGHSVTWAFHVSRSAMPPRTPPALVL